MFKVENESGLVESSELNVFDRWGFKIIQVLESRSESRPARLPSGWSLLYSLFYFLYGFKRWGNLVYQGAEWDGRYEGVPLDAGVFIYMANLKMNDGIDRQFFREVTLIK